MTTAKGRTVLAEFSFYCTDTYVSLGPEQAALLLRRVPCLALQSLTWPFRA